MSGSPLAQFEIKQFFHLGELFGHSIDFTNSSMFMCFAMLLSIVFLYLGTRKLEVKPTSKMQVLVEVIYNFLTNMMSQSIKDKDAVRFFPLVFTIFMFVISCNLLGMLPYSFTVTSHLSITFALALFVLLVVTFFGIILY